MLQFYLERDTLGYLLHVAEVISYPGLSEVNLHSLYDTMASEGCCCSLRCSCYSGIHKRDMPRVATRGMHKQVVATYVLRLHYLKRTVEKNWPSKVDL